MLHVITLEMASIEEFSTFFRIANEVETFLLNVGQLEKSIINEVTLPIVHVGASMLTTLLSLS